MTDGLKDAHREAITAVIAANDRVERAVLFGSRATGTNTVSSDVDIALFGNRLTLTDQARLAAALDEIPMAQSVDVLLYDSIRDRTLREHICVHGVEWHVRPTTKDSEFRMLLSASAEDVGQSLEEEGWLYRPTFPAHWKRRRLYSMARWVNGLAFRNIDFSDTGKPVIKIAEIKGGISDQTKFTHQTFDESVRVRSGDLLFSWSGQPETSIDAFWWRGPEGWLNQHVFRVTPADGIDTTFFFYLLRYMKPNFVAIAGNKQTTGLGHVTKRDLEHIEAAAPPIREQRAIAHVLGTLDDKIELNRRMNVTLEAIARALFRSWFVDFDPVRAKMVGRDTGLPKEIGDLFPDLLVNSELGEIPEGWRVGHVEDGFEIIMGQSPPGHTYNETGDGLPFFQGRSDFGFRYPKNRKFCTAPNRIAQPWDTIVSVRAPVGDINMAWEQCCIGRGVAALRYRSGAVSFGYCAVQALQTHMREYEHTGTVFGAINRKQLARLPLQQPSADVVRAFERLVDPWDRRIRLRTAEAETLTALRGSLLPKLVSGELRVSGLGPASVRDERPAPVETSGT